MKPSHTGGAHNESRPQSSSLTISQDQTAELFRALGRIEQAVTDLSADMVSAAEARSALSKRIGSLERSRAFQKAWMAGAFACGSASLSVLFALYKLVTRKP